MAKPSMLFALASVLALAGCSSSHTQGEECRPVRCEAGQICCNSSCGICVAPGGGCPAIACVDAGPSHCGSELCESGELCCPGCPGQEPFCSAGPSCPDLSCPPPMPSCEECPPGQDCCPSCPGQAPICVPAGQVCPEVDCPAPGACAEREYCACNGECEPLVDLSTGCICPCDDPFNCTGEPCDCGCGGATYLGCAAAGACSDPMPSCGFGCHAELGADGCPVCSCEAD